MIFASFEKKLKSSLPKPIVEALVYWKYAGSRLPSYRVYATYVEDKKGIEIGGPSILFKTTLPLYRRITSLDGVNFSRNTVWEGAIQLGRSFSYLGNKRGTQFIADATDLTQIASNSYDFLLSSNCLEHIANPIKALLEWKRIIRTAGVIILVLPNKFSNFDHNRPFTSFEHILDDFNNRTTEQDLTHLDEILALHDLSMDLPAGTIDKFRQRSLDNFNNRTLHHHVFDMNLIERMLHHVGFNVIDTSATVTDLFVLAVKGQAQEHIMSDC